MLYTVFVCTFLSCTKDAVEPTILLGKYHKIQSIETVINYPSGWSQSFFELFTYDTEGRLYRHDYTRDKRHTIFKYDSGGRLVSQWTYKSDENKIIFRDSLVYGFSGRISNIYHFSINSGPELPLHSVEILSYSSNGLLERSLTLDARKDKIQYRYDYFWEDNNIVKVEDRNGSNQLRHEWFYTYDTQHNYKLNFPLFIPYLTSQTQNNVVEFSLKDYTGLVDLLCNPCETLWQFNPDGLPVKAEYDWGWTQNIVYE